jgi:hypothetical protein
MIKEKSFGIKTNGEYHKHRKLNFEIFKMILKNNNN